ncbi:PHOsphatase [Podila minutissima]|nr:PHOsphatase [Podila minutissima]
MSTNNQTDAKSRTIRPWVVLSAVVALLVCSSVVQGSDVSDYDVAGDILFSGPISHSKHASVVLQPQAASSFKSPSLEHLAQSPPSPTLFELDQARHKGDSSYSHAWLRTHLGTKGPYPHENRPVGRLNDVPEGYELVQLHLLNRHGTRYPSTVKSKAFKTLAEKLRKASSVRGFEWLKDWSAGARYPVERGDLLAARGDSDLYQIGHRFRNRYATFLDKYPYDANAFNFKASTKARCTQSGNAFSSGFFEGRYSYDPDTNHHSPSKWPLVQPVSMSTLPSGLDKEIAVKYACPRWKEQVDGRPELTLRQKTLFEPTFLPQLAAQVTQALKAGVNVTTSDISNIYQLCGFEISIYDEDQTWCRLLRPSVLNPSLKKVDDREHFLNLEILDDLDDFYTHGPGVPFNRHLGCVFATTLLDSIKMVLEDKTGGLQKRGDDEDPELPHHGVFKFGHSETIMFVSSFLGLYHQQGIPLTANMTAEQFARREFRASTFAPFASNMVFEVFQPKKRTAGLKRRVDAPSGGSADAESKALVRMLVNEKPFQVPGCAAMFCDWPTFKTVLETAGAGKNCDFDGCCANGSGGCGASKPLGDVPATCLPTVPIV